MASFPSLHMQAQGSKAQMGSLLSHRLLHAQCRMSGQAVFKAAQKKGLRSRRALCHASAEPETGTAIEESETDGELENPESETARKKAEADRLRAAEKFMVVGTGEATCNGCGYEYSPKNGDPEYPITPGTYFKDLPEDWCCPICGAQTSNFRTKAKEIAGFAENQRYGLGTNSMTSGQKSLLIFGSLLAFFFLFLAGYFIQ